MKDCDKDIVDVYAINAVEEAKRIAMNYAHWETDEHNIVIKNEPIAIIAYRKLHNSVHKSHTLKLRDTKNETRGIPKQEWYKCTNNVKEKE